jgi:hypothetical protein
VFEGAAEHKAGATINGDATFSATAVNNGTVTGTVTVESSYNEQAFISWRDADRLTIRQWTGGGPYNNKWFLDGFDYATEFDAWLSASGGVRQFTGSGDKNGAWAYGTTEYSSQAEAQTAEYEAGFQAWLAANIGVNQYAVEARSARFAYNSTEYPSMEEAQAAYDAANAPQ